ncbi:hypothetical protein NOCA2170006 [metagenome]|uniref:Glycosyltransferase 2-like domain-containing protein n=1 Tax=metagenome TaxID=256318 RepID=A0A2P2BXH5_9ZZZZ
MPQRSSVVGRSQQFARRAARRVARKVVRTSPGRRVVQRVRKPEISLVVPFYNVEDYLAECLDSLLRQTWSDFEVVLVDDGSPDGSRAIAERYAAQDPRIRIITQENAGLGAARNAGIRNARGRYLAFVDSDDLLPAGALRTLVTSAQATGSDIVVGSVERFDSRKTWSPSWVENVHIAEERGVTVAEFLPLLRNLYSWNKLFRRDFWVEQNLWFREGVAYEDQPIISQLYARARSIDVLTDIVYRYRARDDNSSISQQTASLKDLRDRIEAWHLSRDLLRREASEQIYQGWLATLFEAHFHWYLTSSGTVDDTYWTELLAAVRDFAADAEDWVWEATPAPKRVLIKLVLLGRRADAQEFVRRHSLKLENWPAIVSDAGVQVHLPFEGDPELEPDLFLIRPQQLRISHAVENLHWSEPDGAAATCWISGWAYLGKIDQAEHGSTVTVVFREEHSGLERSFVSTTRPEASFPPPRDDTWCDYAPGRFGVEVPLAELSEGLGNDVRWGVWLRVEAAGFTVTHPVTRLLRSGSAGVIPAAPLPDGGRLIAEWQYQQQLRLRVDRSGVQVGAGLEGRVLTVTATDPSARLSRVTAACGSAASVEATGRKGGGGRTYTLRLPEIAPPAPGVAQLWRLTGWSADGVAVPLVAAAGSRFGVVEDGADGTLVLETTRNGELQVAQWSAGAVAERVTISPDGMLTVAGVVHGQGIERVRVASTNKRARAVSESVAVADRRFEAVLPLKQQRYRFGVRPLPIGDHDLSVVLLSDSDEVGREIPLRVAPVLSDQLPIQIAVEDHDGRVVRGPHSGVRVNLQRPIGPARGAYQQNRLKLGLGGSKATTRGVLMRSYFGENATDNGLSIQRELQRRGSDLPVYWAVQDRSVVVPDGGIPVVVNSLEWYDLLSSVTYYIDNMYQPEYHHKPEGQVLVQTFHGYPFKEMGHTNWKRVQFSQARIDAYDARAAAWDYLVSPARYATPLLVREFAYPGEVLEIGYPRNDVLNSSDAPQIRDLTRESLGIRPDQTAVLYAPTFRDYLARDDGKAVLADFFDFAEARATLGDDVVFLARGHAFNARTEGRFGRSPGVLDVTDYPEVSDLYLAADAAIVDYSSLRFDFAVTGKPMIFHVPDLQRYKDTRGWLFDFEQSAPGPLVDTTAEVVERLADLDGVRAEYAEAYATFTADYLDLEDGHAGERFVDAVFVPRGDA